MYHYNQSQNLTEQDKILEQFKKGEISISRAFNLLSSNCYQDKKITPRALSEQSIQQQYQLKKALAEMNNLIGLDNIKELIKEYMAFLQVQKLRQEQGLKGQNVVMHMIFKGNPGTGKTTMARIIGKIFKGLGFLKTGELIECERAELVGEYIGHTAQKTKKLIEKALGGVLFIDEAYSLARGGEKDFGKEAIDTMVKAMEDHKDNLIIILAGYRQEMENFLKANPGLKSRFPIQLDFKDYKIDQLVKIANLMLKEREYILSEDSKYYIYKVLTYIRNQEGNISGNARTVRNLIEKAIRKQAQRIIQNKNYTRPSLITIEKQDLLKEDIINV